ncbi:MAG: GTP-binding protein [Thermomicrobiales bacterium]
MQPPAFDPMHPDLLDEIDPIPVFIVTGREAPLRRSVARTIRAMEPEEPVTMLGGEADGHDGDLAAAIARMVEADEAFYAVLDAPTHDVQDAFLLASMPYVHDARMGLGGVILVIDASRFWADFLGDDFAGAQKLVTQLMEANLIVLANLPAMKKADARAVEGCVRCVEPEKAVIRIETLRKMDLEDVIAVVGNPWAGADDQLSPRVTNEVIPTDEADTAGFERFEWRLDGEVDRERFAAVLDDLPEEIVYAGGMVRFPGEVDAGVTWIRGRSAIEEIGPEMAREMIRMLAEVREEPEPDVDAVMAGADHGSQLSLVGRAIPHAVISARLNACAVDATDG